MSSYDSCSGQSVANAFYASATMTLCAADLASLDAFLEYLATAISPEYKSQSESVLALKASSRLRDFVEDETRISGRSKINLVTGLSGPIDSKIGILLHCPSRDCDDDPRYPVRPFWQDGENASIRCLVSKGFHVSRNFGFDFHWRAGLKRAATESGPKLPCPARSWSQELVTAHNQMTYDLLDMIPCYLLLVGGGLTHRHYRAYLASRSRRFITIGIKTPGDGELNFILEFQARRITRIAILTYHPSSPFFQWSEWSKRTSQLDSGMNFALHLLGQEHSPRSCRDQSKYTCASQAQIKSFFPKGKITKNWARDIAEYRRRERVSNVILSATDYEQTWLNESENYLGETAEMIISQGNSFAEALNEKIHATARETMAKTRSSLPKSIPVKSRTKWTPEADKYIITHLINYHPPWISIMAHLKKHMQLHPSMDALRSRGGFLKRAEVTAGRIELAGNTKFGQIPHKWSASEEALLIQLRDAEEKTWDYIVERLRQSSGKQFTKGAVEGRYYLLLRNDKDKKRTN